MFCLKCGKEIDDHAIFCPYCNSATENTLGFHGFETDNARPVSDKTDVFAIVYSAAAVILSMLLSVEGLTLGILSLFLSTYSMVKCGISKRNVTGFILSIVAVAIAIGKLI